MRPAKGKTSRLDRALRRVQCPTERPVILETDGTSRLAAVFACWRVGTRNPVTGAKNRL
jgi:hypothetical protein